MQDKSLLTIGGVLACMTIMILCGCASQRIVSLDKNDPSIHVTRLGVKIDENFVEIEEVPQMLLENDIPKSRVIHILVDDDLQELQTSRTLMGYLAKAGYSRPVLVTKRHAEVEANRKVESKNVSVSTGEASEKKKPKQIRYKKANR